MCLDHITAKREECFYTIQLNNRICNDVISFNQRLFAAADVGLNALRCRADIIIRDNEPLFSADLTDLYSTEQVDSN